MREVERVLRARARLGEGPVWDAATGTLPWVDILDHRVHRFHPASGRDEAWDVGEVAGCVWPARDGRLLVALRRRVALLDPATGEMETVAEIDLGRGDRLNDGACDARGRFWIGSISTEEGGAALWRVDADGSARRMEEGLTVSNGVGWSPDGGTMYLTDSPAQVIHAYDFDADAGTLSRRRTFVDVTGEDGFPDGLAIDAEGGVWSARFAGGCVVRYAPDGRETHRVAIPAPKSTSCAFGGAELRDLYVTTASVGLSEEEIQAAFDSGDLFRFRADIPGLPVTPFG
ncbi:MAG TPA: SMP-30/gluconolactonase/LRE family protein [Longimicrobium sp.]|nr:SMP-30/gluconolactonase/LRE family protein [Longimicrobium sp.]